MDIIAEETTDIASILSCQPISMRADNKCAEPRIG
jgi:hypothetical protein